MTEPNIGIIVQQLNTMAREGEKVSDIDTSREAAERVADSIDLCSGSCAANGADVVRALLDEIDALKLEHDTTWNVFRGMWIAGIFDEFRTPADAIQQMALYIREASEVAEAATPQLEGASLAGRISTIMARVQAAEAQRDAAQEGERDWAMQASEQFDRAEAAEKRLATLLREGQPWPLLDIVSKLAIAADHLMRAHDCDHHGWEEVAAARIAATEWVARSTGHKPASEAERIIPPRPEHDRFLLANEDGSRITDKPASEGK